MANLLKPIAALTCGAFLATGCAVDDPNQRAKIGAAVGAAVGAVVGNQAGERKSTVSGAAIGAAAGAAIGHYMDKQQREMEEKLAAERARQAVKLERVKEDTLKLNLNSEVTFDTDSAKLKSSFYPSLNKIANIISQYDQTTVRVVGHTDSRGTEVYNQKLSEKRAESVSSYLALKGVDYRRITVEGRGESEPIADNNTEGGRAANRRVEIFLKSNQKAQAGQ
ncbi:MAG TPA: OmpA family protein [Gammaproteobacteria bacterium]|nr:OmpA family protein [Gammaproteobacteria bacterium]